MNAWWTVLVIGVGVLIARRLSVVVDGVTTSPTDTQADPMDDKTGAGGVAPGVRDFAIAIAYAEGFGKKDSIPARAHNPGDLVIPGWTGPTLGAERISVFRDDAEGWAALHRQLQLIIDGRSQVYTLDMSIAEMATHYAPARMISGGTQSPSTWAVNVASQLNTIGYDCDVDTPIGDILTGNA